MAKHLWDLASKKDSLWVKWCHTHMLGDKCLWSCRVQPNGSWLWQKIMKSEIAFMLVYSLRYVMGGIYLSGRTTGICLGLR